MASRQPPSLFIVNISLRVLGVIALLAGGVLVLAPGCASSGTHTSSGLGGATSEGGSNPNAGGSGGAGGEGASDGGTKCKSGMKECKGKCVEIADPDYGCGDTSCTPCGGAEHAQATCKDKKCAIGSCDTGWTNCNGDFSDGCETNTAMDPTQCGACGHVCITPGATPACIMGKCKIGACDAGKTDCNMDPSDGCEADLQTDPQDCGTCLHACSVGDSCQAGMCGDFCPPGLGDCDNDPNNGCETVLHTNTNCAYCGNACMLPHATSDCDEDGMTWECDITLCDVGWADCDHSAPDGCEVSIETDTTNCGTCGNVCPSGPHSTANCDMGNCKLVCDQGYSDCDGDPTTGCEVHTSTDPQNCGSCGDVCTVQNGTAGCTSGSCIITGCNGGYADCDGQEGDGCEVSTNTDTNNCGSCGNHCSFPHSTPSCNNGSCGILSCDAGYKNCDGSIGNGCEVNTTNDPMNCGGCGTVCNVAHGTAACVNSVCVIAMCNPGFQDCDGMASDGCEVNVNTDPSNCGGCGSVCNLPNATASCTGGTCTVASCDPGFQNCNNQPADGCEVDTNNDLNNCGSCNHQCSVAHGSASCTSGNCEVLSCNSPWKDCNGLYGDGCEVNTSTDDANCGACGDNCGAVCSAHVTATSCNNSVCGITGCAANYFDIDGTCADGCECLSINTSSSCAAPTSLGTLSVGQSTSYMGNLVPSGQIDYLQVTFTGNTNDAYHPHVKLTTGAPEFAFDILTNCTGGSLTCGTEGGNSTSKTEWEVFYANMNNETMPVPAVGTIIIRVFRKNGAVTCNGYTLQVSD